MKHAIVINRGYSGNTVEARYEQLLKIFNPSLRSISMAASDYVSLVQQFYVGFYGRFADTGGLNYWTTQLDLMGGDMNAALNAFATSTEAQSYVYKDPSTGTAYTNEQLIDNIYANVFSRTADAEGKAFYLAELDAGRMSLQTIVKNIMDGATGTDSQAIANKVTIAEYSTNNLGSATYDSSSIVSARSVISAVTYDSATLVNGRNAADTWIEDQGGVTGETYTLTTAADSITGSGGNDLINGTYDGAATSTFNVADSIDGGAGTDTIKIACSDDAIASLPAATVQNVEIVKIRNVDGDAGAQVLTVNGSNFVGHTQLISDRSSDSVTFTNGADGASFGINGDGSVTQGAFVASYVAAATAATLNVTNGTKGTGAVSLGGAGVTGVTVNSTGAANSIGALTITGAATTTALTVNAATSLQTGGITGFGGTTASITVSGAATNVAATSTAAEKGAVNLGTIENTTVKTIDASGLTAGGVQAVLNTNVALSVKGGAGNDDITTGAVLTTGSVDAGDGTADILDIGAAAHVATASLGAKYTNFEVLRLNDSQDVSLVSGITGLQIEALTDKIVSKISATQAQNITVLGNQTTELELVLADATGTSDVVSLDLKSNTATSNVDIAGLQVAGVETLNIAATTGTSGTDSDIAFLAGGADKLTAINITGSADVNLVGTNTSKALTLTSTTTGDVTLSGNFVNASTLTTGAGADTVTLGTGFVTNNTGAGNDTINGTAAQLNTGANYNVIDAGDGTDTFNITGGAALTIVDNNLSKISNVEKIVVATTAGNSQSITTGGWFDGAFKANGIDLTTTATTGNISIDMTSFTGAATITATTAGTGGGEGAISIETGTAGGADTITLVNAAAGDDCTIKTYAGNDTIVGGVDAETITGGTGQDVMTGGGTTANTFKWAAGDTGCSDTLYDTIMDFTAIANNVIDAGAAAIVTNATASSGVAAISAAGVATFNAADTTLAQHIVAVEAGINAGGVAAAGQAAMWQEGNDAFLFISDGTDGVGSNDILVKLVGLDTTAVASDTLTDGGTTFTIV